MPIRKEKRREGESGNDFRDRKRDEREETKKEKTPDRTPIIQPDPVSYSDRTYIGIRTKPFKTVDGVIKDLNHPSGKVEISGEKDRLDQHRTNIIRNYRTLKAAKENGYEFLPDGRILQPKYRTTGITKEHLEAVRDDLKKIGKITYHDEIRIDNIGINPKTGKAELLDHSVPMVEKPTNNDNDKNQPAKKEEPAPNSATSLEELQQKREDLLNDIEEQKAKGYIYKNKIIIREATQAIAEIDIDIKVAETKKAEEDTTNGWTLKATFGFEFPEVNLSSEDWESITQDFELVKNSFVAEVIQNYKLLQFIIVIASKLQNNDSKTFVINYVEALKQFYANSESDAAKLALQQPSYFKVFQSLLKRDYKLALASLPNLRNKILADFMIMFIDYQENQAEDQANLSEPTNRIINSYQDKFGEPNGLNFYKSIKSSK